MRNDSEYISLGACYFVFQFSKYLTSKMLQNCWEYREVFVLKVNHLKFALTVFYKVVASHRSSHWRCSVKKGALRNFAKFTGNHLCQSLFFNKVGGLGLQLY